MPDDMRFEIARIVGNVLMDRFAVPIVISQTTSGCALVTVTIGDNTFNLTITRARKKS
jgi:hypothetical protein